MVLIFVFGKERRWEFGFCLFGVESRFCRRDGVLRLLVGVCVFAELGFGAELLSLSQRRGDRHTQDTQNGKDRCCISCIHKKTPC